MRVFLGLLGAILGAVAGLLFLGSFVGDLYIQSTDFQSPDQAGEAHSMSFLVTTFVTMMLGYFIGWFIGRLIERADRD